MKGRGGAGLIFNIPNSTDLTRKLSEFCLYLYKNNIVAHTHKDANLYLIFWELPEYLQSDKHASHNVPPNFSVQ